MLRKHIQNSKTPYKKSEPHHKESSRMNLMNLVQRRFLQECSDDDKNLKFCNSSLFLISGESDAVTKS